MNYSDFTLDAKFSALKYELEKDTHTLLLSFLSV